MSTAATALAPLPVIDPRVRHVGVSKLRELNANELKKQFENNETLVIQDKDIPLVVMLSYDHYLQLQKVLMTTKLNLNLFSSE
jgi:hypothetical protein